MAWFCTVRAVHIYMIYAKLHKSGQFLYVRDSFRCGRPNLAAEERFERAQKAGVTSFVAERYLHPDFDCAPLGKTWPCQNQVGFLLLASHYDEVIST